MYYFVQNTRICEHCERELPVFNEFIMLETFVGWLGVMPPMLYVRHQPNPFNEELNDDSTLHWLCQECYYALCSEI